MHFAVGTSFAIIIPTSIVSVFTHNKFKAVDFDIVKNLKDGCLKGVDEIYGLHRWNYQRYGEVGVKTGPVMASADLLTLR